MWGTVMVGNPTNPAYAKGRTVPKNHADIGLSTTPEDHIDAELVPTLGSHANEVILIPKNCVDEETVHICTGMLTEVRTLRGSKALQPSYGCHEPSLAQGCSIVVLRRD